MKTVYVLLSALFFAGSVGLLLWLLWDIDWRLFMVVWLYCLGYMAGKKVDGA